MRRAKEGWDSVVPWPQLRVGEFGVTLDLLDHSEGPSFSYYLSPAIETSNAPPGWAPHYMGRNMARILRSSAGGTPSWLRPVDWAQPGGAAPDATPIVPRRPVSRSTKATRSTTASRMA